METRAHHLVIGLFVILAIAGGLLFALWLDHSRSDRDHAHYEVFFDRSVSGLAVGNAVEYSGVRVGEVTDLRLDPADPRNVLARIRVLSHVPIRQDTQARLALASITGSMSIQLHGGTPESPRLIPDEDDPPRIVADPSPLSALLDDGEEIVSNVNRVLTRLDALLSEENTESMSQILANLEQTTANLAALGDGPSKLVAQLEALSRKATGTMAELGALTRQADNLLDGHGEEVMVAARQTTERLARTAARLEALLADNEGALKSGLQGIQGLGPASLELRQALGSLNRIIRRLEDNPTDFLLGRDRIEEFTP
jgi:phospholipid/cholesterol/gamma-HCH transport system substrate-binding protein